MDLLPLDVSNKVLSLCSSYMPASVLIDVSFFTTHCFGAFPVWEKLAGGQFNDADLCARLCVSVYSVSAVQTDKPGHKFILSSFCLPKAQIVLCVPIDFPHRVAWLILQSGV